MTDVSLGERNSSLVDDKHTPSVPALILASASPRRQQLLREAGYRFVVHPADIDEDSYPPQMLPAEIAAHLSQEKAKVISNRFPRELVLAADTVVAFGDQPLGKPEGPEEARQMLSLLSGTSHIVITGVTLLRQEPIFEQTRTAMSAVRMREMSESQIEAYVASGQWRGKAGGYGIQDDDPFVIRMSGSLTNVVGLPMEVTRQLLSEAGLLPASSVVE